MTARARRCSTCSTATCATPTWTSYNAPGVWRDFGINVARQRRQPAVDAGPGQPRDRVRHRQPRRGAGNAPGGIAAQGAAGNYWNGPYGYGHYLSRFLLPDNGLVNWDGNRLRGNFYAFQVGTVKFISLDADDVIYQDGASAYLNARRERRPGDHLLRRVDPQRHGHLQPRCYTGDLKFDAKNNSLVPDFSGGRPNLQTLWLEETLAQARREPVGRHDRGVHAPVRDVDLGPRQRLRPGHPPGLAAAVRQVRGRPGAVGPRARLRAELPGPRLRRRRVRHRRLAEPGPDPGREGRHPPPVGGRPPIPTSTTAPRPGTPPRAPSSWCSAAAAPTARPTSTARTRPTTCRRPRSSPSGTPSPDRRRPGSTGTRPTRSRTRPGRRRSTRPTPTATRSSTLTRASGPARRRSPSSTSRSRR